MIPAVNASSRDTFLASLGRCRATAGFLDAFYQRFVASSDEVRAKFAKSDMMRQVRVMEDTLFVVANAVQGEEGSPARSDLPRIAERHSHRDLDIRPELYDLFLECLIVTVRTHDAKFTREVMGFGIDYMRKHY
jgi:hemoglobin-like flavoprotein